MGALLSCREAKTLLKSRGKSIASISLDLGITETEVRLDEGGVHLPEGALIPWSEVEKVAEDCGVCYHFRGAVALPIRSYSEITNRVVALMPTSGAPTITLSGIAMHRIRGIDPWTDTKLKLKAIGRIRGKVLDVCTGLGYTAIQASEQAESVLTVELDPTVLETAAMNPWSRELFESEKITAVIGNAADIVAGMPAGWFDFVIHDPPLFGLAGELYSLQFYKMLWRVLRKGGRLFHYVGNPDSKMSGNVTKGAANRLQEAGFRVIRKPAAFGLLALKY